MYWDGTYLLIADTDNGAIRRYEPITGSLRTVMSTYTSYVQGYSAKMNSTNGPYYDTAAGGTLSAGTGTVGQVNDISFVTGWGFVVANRFGLWKLD
jgi:hypothetical protein